MISVECDDKRVLAAFERLIRAGVNPSPVLKEIGEDLIESTKERIDAGGPGPDGIPWSENSSFTMALAAKLGRPKVKGNHPLIGSGILMETISKNVSGNTLYVGTDRFADEWQGGAALFHFGTTRAGRGHKVTIPARPFLGISASDAATIESTLFREISRLIDKK